MGRSKDLITRLLRVIPHVSFCSFTGKEKDDIRRQIESEYTSFPPNEYLVSLVLSFVYFLEVLCINQPTFKKKKKKKLICN